MTHGRTNACHWCDGSFKFQAYNVNGNHFCSSTCVVNWQHYMQKLQLSLQPVVEGREADKCTCRTCRDP